MSKVNFSDPVVERAIFYHRFAALVEVTNGIIDPIRRQEKKKQIKKGKRLIESRFGDEVEVVGGLALIRNTEKEIKELQDRIQNHIREHKAIVNKEDWGAGKFKRDMIKDLKNQVLFLLRF